MNKEIKDKWIADLRSGQYQQGRRRLRITTSTELRSETGEPRYCCLGVLYMQAVAAGIADWKIARTHLPPAVRDWAGLDFNPAVTCDGKYHTLAILNDAGVPFTQIADLIEEQL